jgi:hypothetical protein
VNKYQHQAIDKRVIKTYDLNDLVVLSTLVSGQVVLKESASDVLVQEQHHQLCQGFVSPEVEV